jgi:hypothetical protein
VIKCAECGREHRDIDDEDADEDGERYAVQEYLLPTHNGVFPTPTKTLLCDVCAYCLADTLADLAEARGDA